MAAETIDDLLPELVALRRDLHAHTELAFEERRNCRHRRRGAARARAGRARGGWPAPASSAQLEQAEVMHIVAGRGAFTPAGGATIEFGAGDTLFFPSHTRGVWRIDETLRKVFVVMAPG